MILAGIISIVVLMLWNFWLTFNFLGLVKKHNGLIDQLKSDYMHRITKDILGGSVVFTASEAPKEDEGIH